MDTRVITLGNDASWTGWGWCLGDQHGPLQVGHLALGPPRRRKGKTKARPNPELCSTHRPQRLRNYMHGPLEHVLADGQLLRTATDPLVRVVVEVPPLGYKRGKASAYVGVGRMVGALEQWGCRPTLAAPWVREPGDWRDHWGIPPSRRGRGSVELKRDAIALVERMYGAHWLQPFQLTPKGGPRGDVAEAILMTVASSQDPSPAPATPEHWPATPKGLEYRP